MFTAGNLLPPQVLAAPIFEAFKLFQLPYSVSDSGSLLNQLYSVVLVNTAFQIGFCTFVLSNYMKALPMELTEAARVDGASVWRQYWNVVMPLTRPALAALGTLEVIFIYNDFFWPLVLIQSGDRLPVTTAINNLQGEFLSNYNLLAAGATITVIPTLIVYLLLQRQFVAGLTLGASKG
jgi:multiple sugar transport system permease protein